MASLDDNERRNVVEKIITLLKETKNWGYKVAVIHGSGLGIYDNEREKHLVQSKLSLEEICNYTQGIDIELALECLPGSYLGNSIQEMKYLIEGTEIKVCFDVNHLVKESHEDFINQFGKSIVTTHLSDHDGIDQRHWIPGMGKINWKNLYSGLNKVGYGGPLLFEVSRKLMPDGSNVTPERILQGFLRAITE